MKCGGGSRTRTGDIRLAKPTLYQLSYAPIGAGGGVRQRFGLAGGFQFSFWEARRASPPRHVSPGRQTVRRSERCKTRRIDHRNSRLLGVRLLRKEVIQPQVPLRLPCYDFIPITTHTLGDSLPCGLGRRLRVQTAFMM